MANKRDYYEVLGISKNASQDDIKRAFRKKAMEYHPDRNKAADAEAKFKEVNEAYEVLSDQQKRQQYDQFGHAGVNEQQGFGQQGGGFEDIFKSFFGGGQQGGGFSFNEDDLFGSFFGGRQQSRRSRKNSINRDIEIQITISFAEMARGTNKKFAYAYKKECPHCHGSGAETPKDIKTCPECNGSGIVLVRQQTPFGTIQSQTTCPRCKGTGKIITKKCHQCNGAGYIEDKRECDLPIPPGIENGSVIQVTGMGNQINNGTGNLLVHVMIAKSNIFDRRGNKIYVKVIVNPLTAIVGGTIDVPTPYGIKQVELKPQTKNEELITIPNMGINSKKNMFSSKDDLIAIIIYGKPPHYNKDDLEKLRSLQNIKDGEIDSYLKRAKSEIE
ncbi:MAG: molecular chaperone DnaJ [Mycoplasmataceae bacterium]|jgi:molecular chaperone DnaJ|nr:molecular chaperone DnaJ [Mycoplasmataceae bacterium]